MRDTKTIVYGSSYDRGLEHLLKMWPDVLKEVPDAKLRIFYGWDLFDMGYKDNPERMAWKEKMNKLMEQEGITHLGRISHEAVKVEFENAGIWAYPCHFGEISCITAMKAQAYGAWPVVVNYAALKETVQYGEKIDGDIYEPEVRDAFKTALCSVLLRTNLEEKRLEMQKWAKDTFAWSKVAEGWVQAFTEGVSLEKQIDELMENNQALKAWELVKDTDSPLKEKLWPRIKHAFEPTAYKKYYENDLVEHPVPEEIAIDCTKLAPRFALVVPKILDLKPKTVVDLGCADGYLCMTLANKGITSYGVNLYKPSIFLARERAERLHLPAHFEHADLFDVENKGDVVVMMEVLEHLPDPRKGVEKAMSLLNKGGSAFFSSPREDHVGVEQHKLEPGHKKWDEETEPAGHLRLFSEKEFKDLFIGYKIVDYIVDGERCMIAEVKHE